MRPGYARCRGSKPSWRLAAAESTLRTARWGVRTAELLSRTADDAAVLRADAVRAERAERQRCRSADSGNPLLDGSVLPHGSTRVLHGALRAQLDRRGSSSCGWSGHG